MKTILLLGSGELGKEFAIAAQRLGQTVVACDKYAGAPAMQVADAAEVFDMLDGDALAAAVAKHRPDIIVPEIEAIRTERLYEFERAGVQVVPSARAVNFTMNRKAIRDLAAKELGLKTARYFYAASLGELREAVREFLPKAAFYDEFVERREWFKSTRIADELNTSSRDLHRFLHEEGICMYSKQQWVVLPAYRSWQCDVPYTWKNDRGEVFTFGSRKRWTPAGRECIIELWWKKHPEYR